MSTLIVTTDPRTARRKQQKSLTSNIVAYIIELITNSDDSYKRLENSNSVNKEIQKPIYIFLEKIAEENIISVVDNAEGFTDERVVKVFFKYGGDNSGGNQFGSRGIFGQGASDVMFNAAMDGKKSVIYSSKNGKFISYKFIWNKGSDPKSIEKIDPIDFDYPSTEIRDFYNLPQNGTVMSFGIPSFIKFDEKSLVDDLESAPSLRYILSQENRQVFLIKGTTKLLLSSSRYLDFDKANDFKEKFTFNYSGHLIDCEINLFTIENSKVDFNKGEIITTDKNSVVYASSLFGFEKNPRSKLLHGTLIMNGFYDLCRYHLNKDNPDEILNEDRTGFNTRHDFYKTLTESFLDKIIKQYLNDYLIDDESIQFSKNKKFKKALTAINKWMAEELKREIPGGGLAGKIPPLDGLDFGRLNIQITKGFKYDLKLYINSTLIESNQVIDVSSVNNLDNITLSTDVISYDESEIQENGLVVKSITLKAINLTNSDQLLTINAKYAGFSKSIAVTVLEEEIMYPKSGLEFEHKAVKFTKDGFHKSVVWFDTNFFALGTKVECKLKGMDLLAQNYTLNQNLLVNDHIGKFIIESHGGEIDLSYSLILTIPNTDFSITQSIQIVLIPPTDKGTNGMITDIKLWTYEGAKFQSTFDEKSGIIYINPKSEINKLFLGDLSSLDPDNPLFNQLQSRYLADLISHQVALIDLKEQDRKNKFLTNDRDSLDNYMNSLNIKKHEVFLKIVEAMA